MGGCFPCFGSSNKEGNSNDRNNRGREVARQEPLRENSAARSNRQANRVRSGNSSHSRTEAGNPNEPTGHIAAQIFTFRELSAATNNFRPECFLGEGGFGKVYKGKLENTGQVVAIKQLDQNSLQGNREFLVEVLMLSMLHHPNLVNLVGYCVDGGKRLLVYEYMPLGSLDDHLHDVPPDKEPLDWNTRMKIAFGAAQGLDYLHNTANPPVIYRDLKSSNILLDDGYFPKLSDFGLAKVGPVGDQTHVSTRVMGTYGYCAPEYAMTGHLTIKSDIYSFGVLLLELITGRKALDNARASAERNIVEWARPLFKKKGYFPKMADPLLQGHYPTQVLYHALGVAALCLQEQADTRPRIGEILTALTYFTSKTYDPNASSSQNTNVSPPNPGHGNDRGNASDTGGELQRIETGGGSGSKSGLDESARPDSQRDNSTRASRTRGSPRNRDIDREPEEERSFDGTNE